MSGNNNGSNSAVAFGLGAVAVAIVAFGAWMFFVQGPGDEPDVQITGPKGATLEIDRPDQ
ncbi:hypothetical protein PB2503_09079 [Parvularcula bermudensis HTCC2503]|uniref:Uncharacterized protein n=1 Tax=Parvularcula bermudensis (strain ATCC BAA-594 / HTCC2503 / KCTC 12087) TaxID=314260 RepID=E0TCT0_PARBH|nr:hypothetical protein [Parvularcula bermudensis]ADM09869.1 hypothetical protein PB2503_09079 [Parvularcula bermudensis HTCC2503]